MLTHLLIKNLALLETLDLPFFKGMTVLTGETGAGKSILLDAISLALGLRADSALVGSTQTHSSVQASFEVKEDHPLWTFLNETETGLDLDSSEDLILKRTLTKEGRSKAFVNNQPCSAALLRKMGSYLLEIQGQFDVSGLLNPSSHQEILDSFAKINSAPLQKAWVHCRNMRQAEQQLEGKIQEAQKEETYLRETCDELSALDPQPDEETTLLAQRKTLLEQQSSYQLFSTTQNQLDSEASDGGVLAQLNQIITAYEGYLSEENQPLQNIHASLQSAFDDLQESSYGIGQLLSQLDVSPHVLEQLEDRLHALRDCARKYHIPVQELFQFKEQIDTQLASIEDASFFLKEAHRKRKEAEALFYQEAQKVTQARQKAAHDLEQAVNKELPSLKLDKASFSVAFEPLNQENWASSGAETLSFAVQTNPGRPAGPLHKIASGGELSRFLLALKLALAQSAASQTLIFDEIDSGVGGATASSIGQRLKALAQSTQVLLVTHSPQVASCAKQHLLIEKNETDGVTQSQATYLNVAQAQEEVARMLAGENITEEARAAALRLREGS